MVLLSSCAVRGSESDDDDDRHDDTDDDDDSDDDDVDDDRHVVGMNREVYSWIRDSCCDT